MQQLDESQDIEQRDKKKEAEQWITAFSSQSNSKGQLKKQEAEKWIDAFKE